MCGGEGGKGEDEGQMEKCPSRVNNHSQWGFSISALSFFFNIEDLRRPSVRGAELSSVDRQADPSTA